MSLCPTISKFLPFNSTGSSNAKNNLWALCPCSDMELEACGSPPLATFPGWGEGHPDVLQQPALRLDSDVWTGHFMLRSLRHEHEPDRVGVGLAGELPLAIAAGPGEIGWVLARVAKSICSR